MSARTFVQHPQDPPPRDPPPRGSALSLERQAGLVAAFLERSSRLFVLTGAGCSTESGIPDYRDAEGAWKRKQPIQWKDFAASEAVRRRYWARGLVGWRSFSAAEPNDAHRALARLERAGRVGLLVTQNVDGLHQKAGSRRVLDLHGRLDRVRCRSCRLTLERARFQRELARLNPGWAEREAAPAPDGDAELETGGRETAGYGSFRVPPCPRCAGVLRPGFVFFGEGVPEERSRRAYAALERADGLLVVGSSLMVWSGFRFAKAAAEAGLPLMIVNLGRTRADGLASAKVEAPAGEVLPAAVSLLE